MPLRYKYKNLTNSWPNGKESYFVSYAVRGPMVVPSYGLEAGMPVRHPISGPVHEPSPLNSQYLFNEETGTNTGSCSCSNK